MKCPAEEDLSDGNIGGTDNAIMQNPLRNKKSERNGRPDGQRKTISLRQNSMAVKLMAFGDDKFKLILMK